MRKGELFNLEDEGDFYFPQKNSLRRELRYSNNPGLVLDAEDNSVFAMQGNTMLKHYHNPFLTGQEKEPQWKSKNEVMKEVMAKSKRHRYEQQKARDKNLNEVVKLDAEIGGLRKVLCRGPPPASKGEIKTEAFLRPETPKPDLPGLSPSNASEKSQNLYDLEVGNMFFDKRSRPSGRTKTAEERTADENSRLREIKTARDERMRAEESDGESNTEYPIDCTTDAYHNGAAEYGLGQGIPLTAPENSEISSNINESEVQNGPISIGSSLVVNIGATVSKSHVCYDHPAIQLIAESAFGDTSIKDAGYFHNYECPQTHEEMLAITKSSPTEHLPAIVQRIRKLHHPALHVDNKTKLAVRIRLLLIYFLKKHFASV